MSRKKSRRKIRSKEVLQEALDLYERAINGDADALIKIWEIVTEDDESEDDSFGYYK